MILFCFCLSLTTSCNSISEMKIISEILNCCQKYVTSFDIVADGMVPKPLLKLGCQGVNRWHWCSHGEANGRQQEGRFSDGFQSAPSGNIIKRYQQVSGIAAEEEKVY